MILDMISDPFIEQAEQNINLLLAEKRFKEAYQKCEALILQFPGEEALVALKERIEQDIRIANSQVIETRLKELEKLFEEKEYVLVLRGLKELLKLDQKSPKLNDLFSKTQALYAAQLSEMEDGFIDQQRVRLEKIFEDSPADLLEELFVLDRNNASNKRVHDLTASFRDLVIKKKIEEMADLLYSDKYDAIAHFISELQQIDEKNPRIAELKSSLQHVRNDEQFSQKSEFIYSGEKHLDTLIKLKKYDQAMKVAEEILHLDPGNLSVIKLLKKASRANFYQTRDLSIQAIEENLPALLSEYEEDSSKFIKL